MKGWVLKIAHISCKKACWKEGRKEGWVGGWVDGKAGLRIAYSNQKNLGEWVEGWMGGWVEGWMGGWVDGWMGKPG
jgi:hypothetical protein